MKRMVLIAGLSLALLCGCNNSTQSTDPSIIAAKDYIQDAVEKKQFVDNSDDISYNYDDNELIYNFIAPYIDYNEKEIIKELTLSIQKANYFSNQYNKELVDKIIQARTKLIYIFRTKYGEYLKFEILPSELESYIKTQSSDISNISDAKEYIKNIVSVLNHVGPISKKGCESDVIYDNENNVVTYNMLLPYINNNYVETKEKLLSTTIQQYLHYDAFRKFYEALIIAKTPQIYNYHTKDGYSLRIVITPSELESCIKNTTN